ncbi:MAG: chloride channel protein [Candidatus Thermoplasmatota archaeon]
MRLTKRFLALNGAAAIVGVLVGLAAVLFRFVINLIEHALFEGEWSFTAQEDNRFLVSPLGWLVVLIPLLGGLAVGVIRRVWPDTKQQGIAEVMAAVQAKGSVLHARSSWGHAIISAITVGTGGSTGREGPIGYIGASVGSSIGRRFGFTRRDMTVLLGSGFSSGIAATFNAPMGAVLLSLELILPEFSTHALIPLIVAAVCGVTVSQVWLGDEATFRIPDFTFGSPWELLAYLLLGLLCGLGGVAFIRTLGWSQRSWGAMPLPEWLKPALGGLLVGLMGLMFFEWSGAYHIFGTGYATVSAILVEDGFVLAVPILLALLVLKPLATATTIGSGGGGGVFSASLYTGAVYGGLVGLGVAWLAPFVGADPAAIGGPGAYALVGMAAFYAATARATLTAIVIIAELANEYTILLPVMLCAITADALSIALSRDSVYTVRLAQRGILFDHDRTTSPLELTLVKEVMTRDVHSLPATITVGDAFNRMLDYGHTGYPVVDGEGKLAGIVTRRDLSRHLHAGRGAESLASVVSGLCITSSPDEVLHRARDRMFQQDVGRLVVVDPKDRRRVVGILTRSDLLRAEAEKDVEHGDFFGG